MKKLSITEEELQQSLSQFNAYTLENLSETLCEATCMSTSDQTQKYTETPLRDLFNTIWDAVIEEKRNRKSIAYYEDNQYIRTL